MDVHDEYISAEEFATIIERVPEVCVELVLRIENEVLLARRTNEPAREEWFWPGTRLYKGETLTAGAHRVGIEELGIKVDLVERLGIQSHFWEESPLPGHPSRHTVNVVFLAEPNETDPTIELDDQHSEYRLVEAVDSDFHDYVQQYFNEYDIP